MRLFDGVYTLLATLIYLLALPLLLFGATRQKYRRSLPSRFWLANNPPFDPYDVWFHVCSLGEAKALAPVIESLSHVRVAITVTTQTGYDAAMKYPNVQVRYLPYEIFLWFWIRAPKTVVVLEAEFWYLLFRLVHHRGGRVIALNARISDRSYPKYFKMRWFYRRLLGECEQILCQSVADKGRFEALGGHNVEVVGNIKLAQKIITTRTYPKPQGYTLIAASTHEGEEEGILEAFVSYQKRRAEARLILVPRHPERFEKVYGVMCRYGEVSRWSEAHDLAAQMILVDAMGELNNLYAISDVAILGGAFAPIGGHNPLEPAHFGCRLISGEAIFLQRELFRYVRPHILCTLQELPNALEKIESYEGASVCETIDIDHIVARLIQPPPSSFSPS